MSCRLQETTKVSEKKLAETVSLQLSFHAKKKRHTDVYSPNTNEVMTHFKLGLSCVTTGPDVSHSE